MDSTWRVRGALSSLNGSIWVGETNLKHAGSVGNWYACGAVDTHDLTLYIWSIAAQLEHKACNESCCLFFKGEEEDTGETMDLPAIGFISNFSPACLQCSLWDAEPVTFHVQRWLIASTLFITFQNGSEFRMYSEFKIEDLYRPMATHHVSTKRLYYV